jgi:Na+/melibiose symporter-like transporter
VQAITDSDPGTRKDPAGPDRAPPPGLRARGGLFRHYDFRQLFIADVVSQCGTQLSLLALPVLAVRALGANEFQMGVLTAFETLAFLVIGLPAGAWVDRWRKQRVLVASDLLRGLALLSLPVAWWLDALTLGQMYAVALVVGVGTVFFDVAYQSYLPEIVPSASISEGNAKLQSAESVAHVAGPAVGGLLIRFVGAPVAILVDAVSFVLSAFFVGRIRQVTSPPARSARRSLHLEIGEGLAFVVRHPLLSRIAACTSISNLFGSMAGALIVLFALRDLQLTEAVLGLSFSAGAVGGLAGALTSNRLIGFLGEGRAIPLAAIATVPGGALLPLAGTEMDGWQVPAVPALIASSFVFTFWVVVYNVTQVSFRQRLCPKPLLGRMNASIRFFVWGTMPVGAFIGGVLGTAWGIRPVLWLSVLGYLIAVLPVLFSPLIRMRDLPAELDQHA